MQGYSQREEQVTLPENKDRDDTCPSPAELLAQRSKRERRRAETLRISYDHP